jgi:hypothetical protein
VIVRDNTGSMLKAVFFKGWKYFITQLQGRRMGGTLWQGETVWPLP